MENLEKARVFLQGKKTYFVTLVGLLYVVGVWAGFWELDEKMLALFGLGGLAFLRSAFAAKGTPLLATAGLCFCMAGAPLLLTGCKTVTTSTGETKQVLDVSTTKAIIAATVPTAVSYAVMHDDNCRPYLAIASATIRAAVSTNVFDPATITAQFEASSAKELHTEEAKLAVTAAINIYRAYFDSVLSAKLSESEYLVPILTAVADAIDQGLGTAKNAETTETTKTTRTAGTHLEANAASICGRRS